MATEVNKCVYIFVYCKSILQLTPQVRCWEVQDNGQTVPKAQQMHTGPVLDTCWSDVGAAMCGVVTSVLKPFE